MTTRYFSLSEAATYLGIPEELLRRQCKMRLGPAFTKPSERKYLFRSGQPWTREQANAFVVAAWQYLGIV